MDTIVIFVNSESARKAKMDAMETLDFKGWQFLCSGEQLPSGLFHPAVRWRDPETDQIRTLVPDSGKHDRAGQALERAREVAMNWANERADDGHGKSGP